MDRPTGRYYCNPCFAPTLEEQFREDRLELAESVRDYAVEEEFDTNEEAVIPREEQEE